MGILHYSVLFITVVTMIGCTKPDNEAPTVEWIKPRNGDIISLGQDSLHVKFIIRDNESITKVYVNRALYVPARIKILDTILPNAASYTVNDSFMPQNILLIDTISVPMSLSLQMEDNQNIKKATLNFRLRK